MLLGSSHLDRRRQESHAQLPEQATCLTCPDARPPRDLPPLRRSTHRKSFHRSARRSARAISGATPRCAIGARSCAHSPWHAGVVTVHRREILGGFGVGAAATLLWAFGCRAQLPAVRRAPQVSRDVRSWLHDAVGRLAAVYPSVHALAV